MILEAIGLIFLYFVLFFLYGTLKKDNSVVDFGWGMGFVLVSFYAMFRMGNFGLVSLITTLLVTLWGGRLFYHIFKRNHGKPEDFRYANWRKEWGKWVIPRAFFQVYLLQGAFMFAIAFPLVWIHEKADQTLSIWGMIGILIWLTGYYFEVVGDAQLAAFKKNSLNKGKLMTTGLWQYTRHPNYFGEATMWWGIWLLGMSVGNSVLSILSPVIITFLLRFVSGVPMLEKAMIHREGYEAYAKRTNVFVPWFKKGA